MNPVKRIPSPAMQIKRAGAQRIIRSRRHIVRQARLPFAHFAWRPPRRPLNLAADTGHASPGKTVATDADKVLLGLAVRQDPDQRPLLVRYYDGSDRFIG